MIDSRPFPLDILREPGADTLERLLAGWLGPSPQAVAGDAFAAPFAAPSADSRAPTPATHLPAALADGLATLARWPGVFRRNRLRAPHDVDAVDGLGRFLVEGEGHGFWGFALVDGALADPRIWMDDDLDGRRVADPRASRFLVKATLLELVLGDCSAEAGPGGMAPADLTLGLVRLDELGPLTWPTTCWFHAGPDDLAMTMDDGNGEITWGWRAVRRPAPPQPAAVRR